MAYRQRNVTTYYIHQMLHGYKDGHRLIRTSLPLTPTSERQLLILSDNSGVLPNPVFDGYVTGYPLKGEACFALSRTWAAPEMNRPGCVWTHTLIVPNDLIVALDTLTGLCALHVRPYTEGFENYGVPLSANSSSSSMPSKVESTSIPKLEQLMLSFYQMAKLPLLFDVPSTEVAEALIMSVWAQCWPRLRLSLSFCSATTSPRLKDNQPLALQGVAKGRTESKFSSSLGEADWVRIILGSDPARWHSFLGEYAKNMVARPGLMPPTAKVFEHLVGQVTDVDDLLSTAKAALTAFGPESKSERIQFALVDRVWDNARIQRALLTMLLQLDQGGEARVRGKILTKFRELVESRPEDGLSFVKASYSSQREYRKELLSIWARRARPRKVVGNLEGPMLLDLVETHVELLTLPETWRTLGSLAPAAFAAVDEAKMGESKFAAKVAKGVLIAGAFESAKLILRNCGKQFVGEMITQLAALKSRMGESTTKRWVEVFQEVTPHELDHWVFENMILAATLEPSLITKNQSFVVEKLEVAWNLPVGKNDVVDATLLVSALHPQRVDQFFVRSGPRFSAIYARAASDKLSGAALVLLDSFLPKVAPEDKWDTCERMRQGLLRGFLSSSLEPQCLQQLKLNDKVMRELAKTYLKLRLQRKLGARLDDELLSLEERKMLEPKRWKKSGLIAWLTGED